MSRGKPKRREAVALRYNSEQDAAPRVTAKGQGFIADRILEAAKQHGIPVREEADLLPLLAQVDLQDEIPPALYRAVAEILAFVYAKEKEFARLYDNNQATDRSHRTNPA